MYCPIGTSPIGNPGCFPRRKSAATESRCPTYGPCWVLAFFHNRPRERKKKSQAGNAWSKLLPTSSQAWKTPPPPSRHNPTKSDVDNRIFHVRTDVNACDCTRGGGGGLDTVRESALKADSGKKIPCRNGESNLPPRRDCPTLYQLS